MHRIDLSLFYCVILLEEHGWQQARRGKLFARSRITQQSAEQQQFMGNKIQLSRYAFSNNKKCGSIRKVRNLVGSNFKQKTPVGATLGWIGFEDNLTP